MDDVRNAYDLLRLMIAMAMNGHDLLVKIIMIAEG
jgi:hypothetical protein